MTEKQEEKGLDKKSKGEICECNRLKVNHPSDSCKKFKAKNHSPQVMEFTTPVMSGRKLEGTFNLSEKMETHESRMYASDWFHAEDVKEFINKIADKCFVIDGFSADGKIVVDIEDVKELAGDDLR